EMATEPSPDTPLLYEICVQASLPDYRREWFQGLHIRLDEHGHTLLTGPVRDQAALHGYLERIRDLGLVLISVRRLTP
ncbi:MAG: hypothetical protein GYA17_08620, partial [Chloroflexi bacterium]|nr:hypothetical protein [Chloroflexota bacterium]